MKSPAEIQYRYYLRQICEKLRTIKPPELLVDKRLATEPDLSDWFDSDTGTIYVSSPFDKWNLLHEMTHYLFWLKARRELEPAAEENFIEFFVHE